MKPMPRLLATLAIAALLGTVSTAKAQGGYNNGYGFGLGFGLGNGFPYPGMDCNPGMGGNGYFPFRGFGPSPRVDEPPYFAKFPPVYYSDIVRRPYGVSPYAAPPGIVPVEMQPMAAPVRIVNPHFKIEESPVAPEADLPPEDPSVATAAGSAPMLEPGGSGDADNTATAQPVESKPALKSPARPRRMKSTDQ